MRATHFPGSPSRTIWAPFPRCPARCARSSLFWLLWPPLPRPQPVVFQAQKVGTHQPTSLVLISQNLASQLSQTFPLQDPLWGSRLGGDSWRPPQTLMDTHLLFSWARSPFSVPRPVPLRLLSQEAGFVGQTRSAFNNKMINKSKYTIKSLRVGACQAIL